MQLDPDHWPANPTCACRSCAVNRQRHPEWAQLEPASGKTATVAEHLAEQLRPALVFDPQGPEDCCCDLNPGECPVHEPTDESGQAPADDDAELEALEAEANAARLLHYAATYDERRRRARGPEMIRLGQRTRVPAVQYRRLIERYNRAADVERRAAERRRQVVLDMHALGIGYRPIGEALGLDKTTVERWIKDAERAPEGA